MDDSSSELLEPASACYARASSLAMSRSHAHILCRSGNRSAANHSCVNTSRTTRSASVESITIPYTCAYREDQWRRSTSIRAVESRRARRCSNSASERRSEEHTSELQSHSDLVCRLLLEKKKKKIKQSKHIE